MAAWDTPRGCAGGTFQKCTLKFNKTHGPDQTRFWYALHAYVDRVYRSGGSRVALADHGFTDLWYIRPGGHSFFNHTANNCNC